MRKVVLQETFNATHPEILYVWLAAEHASGRSALGSLREASKEAEVVGRGAEEQKRERNFFSSKGSRSERLPCSSCAPRRASGSIPAQKIRTLM
jgi:hypothetical protein